MMDTSGVDKQTRKIESARAAEKNAAELLRKNWGVTNRDPGYLARRQVEGTTGNVEPGTAGRKDSSFTDIAEDMGVDVKSLLLTVGMQLAAEHIMKEYAALLTTNKKKNKEVSEKVWGYVDSLQTESSGAVIDDKSRRALIQFWTQVVNKFEARSVDSNIGKSLMDPLRKALAPKAKKE